MAGNLILFILLSLLIEVCLLSLLLDGEIFGLCSKWRQGIIPLASPC